jgi:hypothetical protein
MLVHYVSLISLTIARPVRGESTATILHTQSQEVEPGGHHPTGVGKFNCNSHPLALDEG